MYIVDTGGQIAGTK